MLQFMRLQRVGLDLATEQQRYHFKKYFSVWTSCVLFIHSSTDRYLGCFHFRASVNSALVNIHVHIFVGKPVRVLLSRPFQTVLSV